MSEKVSILGNVVTNLTGPDAIQQLEQAMRARSGRKIYIVNAHTLNLAAENPDYAAVLRRSDLLLGDGSGVRLAAKMRRVTIKANLVGTDLVPAFLKATAGQGYRCYLLGANAETIERSAEYFRQNFHGWILAGYHHGYLTSTSTATVITEINRANVDLLLVGMGNPLQEIWIDRHATALRMGIGLGVGGMFDHWAGNLRRAPVWVRRIGCEWVQLLLQQPRKARRYLIGNPLFIWRILRALPTDRGITSVNRPTGRGAR